MPPDNEGPDLGRFSDVDSTGEASPFVAYLDRAASVLKEFRQVGDRLLGLKPGELLLDVGCGTGDATAQLATGVIPGGRTVGIDLSEAMITEARKRAAGSDLPLEFRIADAHDLPFPDNHFDACSAERVFVHLADPLGVLAEMVRVVKPGGRVVVREADLDMIAIDASDRATTRAIVQFFADSMRNGWIGRQLFRLFEAANLVEVAFHPHPYPVTSFGVLNTMLPFEQTARSAADSGVITAEAASAWIADQHQRDAAGRSFACLLGFIASGRKSPNR